MNPSPSSQIGSRWRSEIAAGLMSTLVCLPLSLGCGLLAFAPLGPDYVAAGATAGLYGGAIVGAVAAIIATSSYIVTTARVSMALVQAGLASTLIGEASFAGQPAMVVTAIALCLLLAGLWQILFGIAGMTRIIKFAPHPVLTGLLNGVGMLIIISQIKPFFAGFSHSALPHQSFLLAFVILLALFILNYPAIAAQLRLPSALKSIPGSFAGFVIGIVAYYLITSLTAVDLGGKIGNLHLSFPPQSPLLAMPETVRAPQFVAALPHIVLVSLVLAIISTVETLLAFRVAQNLDDTHVHPVRDLVAQGIANSAASLGGGVGGSAIPSVILIAHRTGGRTRWTGIVVAASLLVVTLLMASVLAQIPRAVFIAILLVIGVILFDRWNLQLLADVFRAKSGLVRRHAIYNLLIVVAVMAVTVLNSVVSGVIVGIVLSSIIFVINMSRPLVRRAYFGHELFSKRIRSNSDLMLLQETGPRRAILQLEGALFFGNADSLSLKVKKLFETSDIVLLDMRSISDIDISGLNVLKNLRDKARDNSKHLICCNAKPVHAIVMTNTMGADKHAHAMTHDLDTAIEWMEELSLDHLAAGRSRAEALPLEQIDFLDGVSAGEIKQLTDVMSVHEFKRGDIVCREGDAGDRMWLIVKGSVSVRLRIGGDNVMRRIAGLGRGTTVGEMALVESVRRSATIVADEDVTCYELRRETFDILMKDNPALATKLLGNLAREMARRLRQTSQDLRFAG